MEAAEKASLDLANIQFGKKEGKESKLFMMPFAYCFAYYLFHPCWGAGVWGALDILSFPSRQHSEHVIKYKIKSVHRQASELKGTWQ